MDQIREFFEDVSPRASRIEQVRAKMSPGLQHQFVQDGITVYRGFPDAYRFYLFARAKKYGLSEHEMHKLFTQCLARIDEPVHAALDHHIHVEMKMQATDVETLRSELKVLPERNFVFRRPMKKDMRRILPELDAQQLVDLARDEGLYAPVQSKGNGLLKRR